MTKRRWPTLTCPECGSRTCSEDATQQQHDVIYVSCAICGHREYRPLFSRISEHDFVILTQQLNAALLD